MAYMNLGDQVTLDAAKIAKVNAEVLVAAKAKQASKVLAMRNKGAADAKAGKYAPPPPSPAPDFDTMNYQAGWKSTGAPLPSGVVAVATALATSKTAGAASSKLPLILGGVAALGVVAFVVLRK